MSNSFDLETKMMECWRVVDDIKFIYEEFHDGVSSMSRDQMANLLLGMEQMYERKFERLWDEFEKVCGHGGIFLSESEVLLCKQHRDYDGKLSEVLDDDGMYKPLFGGKEESKEFPTREDIIAQNGNEWSHLTKQTRD